MPCCTFTNEWTTDLSDLKTQYTIRVEFYHRLVCGKPMYRVFVNGGRVPHELIHDGCSPLCGFLGRCEWKMDGHTFLLVENSTLKGCCDKRLRLFVDGIDSETGIEYSLFWRRRGWIYFWIGLILLIVLVACLVTIFCFDTLAMIRPAAMLIIFAVVFTVFGLIAIRKFKKPLLSQSDDVQFSGAVTMT